MFFTFRQNNSGGFYKGPARFVIVEAATLEDASAIAETKGLYFDGAGDCNCCGPRWTEWDVEESQEPEVYERNAVTESLAQWDDYRNDLTAIIFFADGTALSRNKSSFNRN